jgi:hypothetical protein
MTIAARLAALEARAAAAPIVSDCPTCAARPPLRLWSDPPEPAACPACGVSWPPPITFTIAIDRRSWRDDAAEELPDDAA